MQWMTYLKVSCQFTTLPHSPFLHYLNLKPRKAAGPDKLKPLLLKKLRDEIEPIIKVIFDKSLQTGKLPSEWLTANVMHVFKKGDKSLAANYRPISLTCILCKVPEHILASNISGGFRGGSGGSLEPPSGAKLFQFHGEIYEK